jgi:ribosome recycling factor
MTAESIDEKMKKAHEAFEKELNGIRSGRAHPNFLDRVSVKVYGRKMSLNQVASIRAEDAKTLVVSAWDASQVAAIESGISEANLGLNPQTNGSDIRVSLPAMSDQTRQDFVKLAHKVAEKARVSIRHVREEARKYNLKQEKDHLISEDDRRREDKLIQERTDHWIKAIDVRLADKEKDLTQI